MPYLISYCAWNDGDISIGSKVVEKLMPYKTLVDSVCPQKGGVILGITHLSPTDAYILSAEPRPSTEGDGKKGGE